MTKILIGSIAGVVEHLGMYPVDTVKVSQSLLNIFHVFRLTFSKCAIVSAWNRKGTKGDS